MKIIFKQQQEELSDALESLNSAEKEILKSLTIVPKDRTYILSLVQDAIKSIKNSKIG